MTFLAALAFQLGKWILSKLFEVLGKDLADWEKRRAEQKQAADEAEKLKDAKTQEEIDAAARDSLDHL